MNQSFNAKAYYKAGRKSHALGLSLAFNTYKMNGFKTIIVVNWFNYIYAFSTMVGKIDTWARFHQHSTYRLYTRRSQKCKKALMT